MPRPRSIVLPLREDMALRLMIVNPDKQLVQYFYPLILRLAGQPTNTLQLASALWTATLQYSQEMSAQARLGLLEYIAILLHVLIDDQDALAEALHFHRMFLKAGPH